MRFQPITDKKMLSLAEVRWGLKRGCDYSGSGNSEAEDSHVHHCYEIYLHISGDISFLINNHIYSMHSGDLMIARPGDVHLCIYHRPCEHEHVCLWLDVPPDHPITAFLKTGAGGFMRPSKKEREGIMEDFFRLVEYAKTMQEPETTACLFRILSIVGDNRACSALPISDADIPKKLQNVLDLMNTRFSELQSISDVVRETYVSPATLNRWFRRYIHLSPRSFLEAKKLAHAKDLLWRGYSVSEASAAAGFSDCSYFISVFRRKFGQTPLRYKRSLHPREETHENE